MSKRITNPETIVELHSKEIEALSSLKEKKKSLEIKIKESEARIKNYEYTLYKMRLSAADDAFSAKGFSLEDVITAMENGDIDLSGINDKSQIKDILNKIHKFDGNTDFDKIHEEINKI